MKSTSKGFTLTEVLVSVAIAGILVVAVATFFIRYQRLNNRFLVKENMLTEIENVYELYTGSPASFPENLNKYFDLDLASSDKLYYDSNFQKRTTASKNYLELEYGYNEGKYRLKITPYYQGEIVTFTDKTYFLREIRVGGQNEE
jgi:prepilin-type N-terminal cleavage/methylation domain-containing protein